MGGPENCKTSWGGNYGGDGQKSGFLGIKCQEANRKEEVATVRTSVEILEGFDWIKSSICPQALALAREGGP